MVPRMGIFHRLVIIFYFFAYALPAVSQQDTIYFEGNIYARVDIRGEAQPLNANRKPESPELLNPGIKESKVNIKAVRDFIRKYGSYHDVTWYAFKDGFTARFYENDILTSVLYTFSGRWKNATKYYREPNLPKPVRALVKPLYYDYVIVSIYEITWDIYHQPAYYIHMTNGTVYKIIKVSLNAIDEVQTFYIQKK